MRPSHLRYSISARYEKRLVPVRLSHIELLESLGQLFHRETLPAGNRAELVERVLRHLKDARPQDGEGEQQHDDGSPVRRQRCPRRRARSSLHRGASKSGVRGVESRSRASAVRDMVGGSMMMDGRACDFPAFLFSAQSSSGRRSTVTRPSSSAPSTIPSASNMPSDSAIHAAAGALGGVVAMSAT